MDRRRRARTKYSSQETGTALLSAAGLRDPAASSVSVVTRTAHPSPSCQSERGGEPVGFSGRHSPGLSGRASTCGAGRIAARPGEVGDQTELNRAFADAETGSGMVVVGTFRSKVAK